MVTYSNTSYFLDRGWQYGLSYEALKEFEKLANKKLKTKTLKVQVVFIPVSRDDLIPSLLNGLGDIAVANLTITTQRQKQVDFSNPFASGVKELLVTGLFPRANNKFKWTFLITIAGYSFCRNPCARRLSVFSYAPSCGGAPRLTRSR
ncbi:MAG: transporter substrate-binding domain-containing protein [Desulfosarcina sp.]|nr:transporter substrate-binding domain-containing protein [Desulfosarcina sp.]